MTATHSLTLELPDEVYSALVAAAQAEHTTPAAWLVTYLRRELPIEGYDDDDYIRRAVPPAYYALLEELSPAMGKTPRQMAVEYLLRRKPHIQLTETAVTREAALSDALARIRASAQQEGITEEDIEREIALARSEQREWNIGIKFNIDPNAHC